jgi:hypothetical protein
MPLTDHADVQSLVQAVNEKVAWDSTHAPTSRVGPRLVLWFRLTQRDVHGA